MLWSFHAANQMSARTRIPVASSRFVGISPLLVTADRQDQSSGGARGPSCSGRRRALVGESVWYVWGLALPCRQEDYAVP